MKPCKTFVIEEKNQGIWWPIGHVALDTCETPKMQWILEN